MIPTRGQRAMRKGQGPVRRTVTRNERVLFVCFWLLLPSRALRSLSRENCWCTRTQAPECAPAASGNAMKPSEVELRKLCYDIDAEQQEGASGGGTP